MFFAAAAKVIRCTLAATAFLILLGVWAGTASVDALAAERARPDFSGQWHLDAKGSDFGPMPVPLKMVDLIEQTAAGMKVKRSMANDDRQADYEFDYQFDGSEVINKASVNHTRSRAHWDGDTLVVETSAEVEGLPLHIRDKWRLDGHGNLRISRQFQTDRGELGIRLVMVRK